MCQTLERRHTHFTAASRNLSDYPTCRLSLSRARESEGGSFIFRYGLARFVISEYRLVPCAPPEYRYVEYYLRAILIVGAKSAAARQTASDGSSSGEQRNGLKQRQDDSQNVDTYPADCCGASIRLESCASGYFSGTT